MFAFFSTRFAEIIDCFSRVSMMIGIFGFGQVGSCWSFVFENIFSIWCFIIACFVFHPTRNLF